MYRYIGNHSKEKEKKHISFSSHEWLLASDTMPVSATEPNPLLVPTCSFLAPYLSLPEVDDVVLFVVDNVSVEDHVRVSSEELAVHFGVNSGHLKVLNTPHLREE